MIKKTYRLITRSDMDGLICSTFLKYLNLIDEIIFVHPKDMQDGKIHITNQDITANLPFVENAHLVFDHHYSESLRNNAKENYIIDTNAPSTAQIIYQYYNGNENFPSHFHRMLEAANKADRAQFSVEDILKPEGWDLLSFLMDSRTGLGRFKDFRVSNYKLMIDLIDYCANYSIKEILELPDVKERVDMYFLYEEEFKEQLQRCTTIHENLALIDYRSEDIIYPGNRFMIYALYPEVNISIHMVWGKDKQNIVFSTGKSIINKSSKTNIGELMLKYGGGGHEAAGGCQSSIQDANKKIQELIEIITEDG